MKPKICPKCGKDDFDRTPCRTRDQRAYRCNDCNHRWEVGMRCWKEKKLATDLPTPKSLTDEDMKRIDKESTEMVKSVEEHTKNMETLTADDLKIIIK